MNHSALWTFKRRLLSLAMVALCATGCGTQPSATPDETQGPALWVAEAEFGKAYLFGTMHVGKEGPDWFDHRIADRFEESDVLITEADTGVGLLADPELLAEMVAGGDVRIVDRLPAQDRQAYAAALEALGCEAQAFDSLKPIIAAVTLAGIRWQQLGYREDLGTETFLTKQAKDGAKEHASLESPLQQLRFLTHLPEDAQVAHLQQVVRESSSESEQLESMYNAWRMGDIDHFDRQAAVLRESQPAFHQQLLARRNADWASQIETRLREEDSTLFVAVGTLHLAGSDSLQSRLIQLGFRVRRA